MGVDEEIEYVTISQRLQRVEVGYMVERVVQVKRLLGVVNGGWDVLELL